MKLAIEHHTLARPRARIVIVHGYAEHRRRYATIVDRLEARRIECHLFDLRGHGESEGQRGHVNRFEEYLEDLHRVAGEVPRDLPRFLFGHSLGGLIGLSYVRAFPGAFDALIVSSPFLNPGFAMSRVKAAFAQVASRVLPNLPVPSDLEPEWISHDDEVVEQYKSDPHVFRTATPRWFTEITAAQRELYEHAHEITTPALFLIAEDDLIADHRRAVEVFDRLGSPDKARRLYDGLYHEVFNEVERDTVTKDLLSWIDRALDRANRTSSS